MAAPRVSVFGWIARRAGLGDHPAAAPVRQVGALPYVVRDGIPVVLLITTRRSGRWIFPKGTVVDGRSPQEVAAQEATEEAGVTGAVGLEPIGRYRDSKTVGLWRTQIEVVLYPMEVTGQLDSWNEKGQRLRHWATLREARRLLADAQLAAIVDGLGRWLQATGAAQPTAAPRAK